MHGEEGGGVPFGVMAVERKAVILRDLPPQGFAVEGTVSLLAHTSHMSAVPT
jgi:hypothetical protein